MKIARFYCRKENDGWLCYDRKSDNYEWTLIEPDSIDTLFVNNPLLGKHNSKLSYPKKVFLNITKKCNLFCSHCYNNSGEDDAREIPYENLQEILKYLRSRGVFKITLAGGEPTIHRQFTSAVIFANEIGLSLSIISNGLLLGSSRIYSALSECDSVRSVTVSIDGAIESTHDYIRGAGMHRRTWDALRKFRSIFHGKIYIRFSVSPLSFKELPALMEMASKNGIDGIKINPINPYGRAQLLMTLTGARDLLVENFADIKSEAEKLNLEIEMPSAKYRSLDGTCLGGKEFIEIDADESIYPCSFSWGKLKYGDFAKSSYEYLDKIFLSLTYHSLNNDFCLSCLARG